MSEIKEGISRRNFLGGAGLAAVGAGMLGSGMLAGCAPAKTAGEKEGSSVSSESQGEWSGKSAYAQINPQEEIDASNSIGDLWLFGGFCGRDSGIGPAQRAKTTIWN